MAQSNKSWALHPHYIQTIFNSFHNLWDWGQIGTKLRTKHVIYRKLEKFIWKKDVYVNRLESVSSLAYKCIFYRP